MKQRPLGSSGINASIVGFGAWAVGGWMWGGNEEKESINAIHAAIDNGINLVDTAPIYGFGHSEEIVGKAIRDRRDKVVLASKCGLVWNGTKGGHFFDSSEAAVGDADGKTQYHVYRYLGAKSVRAEVEASLRRMGVDHIDVMQTHWQDSTTPIEETMGELVTLRKEGKIRSIGCSNATPEEMDRYRKAGQLDVDQEPYSMINRAMEKTNLPYCAKNAVAFFAYSPLAQGLLTGAVGPDRVFAKGDQRLDDPKFSLENRKLVLSFLNEIRPVADAHKLTLGQLVTAWTLEQTGCSHALLGARNARQVEENAKAGSVDLKRDEIAFVTAAVDKRLGNFGE